MTLRGVNLHKNCHGYAFESVVCEIMTVVGLMLIEIYTMWYFREPSNDAVSTSQRSVPWETSLIASRWKIHDDVIKWKHFPRYSPFVRGIHRGPVNSPHKGQWRGALMFSFICTRINGLVNNGGAGDLRRHRAHYDVIVMYTAEWRLALIPTQTNLDVTGFPHWKETVTGLFTYWNSLFPYSFRGTVTDLSTLTHRG